MISAVPAAALPRDCQTMQLTNLSESCCLREATKKKLLCDEEVCDYMPFVTAVRQGSCPRTPITLRHPPKSYERGYCALSLLISDGIHPGLYGFFPHSRRIWFKSEMGIDISDVLYSDGEWFLLREEKMISFWHVSLEQKWRVTETDEIIHQGYFSGNPPFDCRVVLAAQLPPEEENETVTSLWTGRINDDVEWQKKKVNGSYEDRGIHSIILFQDMILWLTDDGSLCSVKQSSEGIHISAQKGACESNTMNFSLVQHRNKLYIVKSGGFLPCETPGIYEVIPGSQTGETAIQETTLDRKDIFVVHDMGGFILPSDLDDCRIFTGSMLPNVECAMFSSKTKSHEKIMCCQYALHLACKTVWARLGTVAHL